MGGGLQWSDPGIKLARRQIVLEAPETKIPQRCGQGHPTPPDKKHPLNLHTIWRFKNQEYMVVIKSYPQINYKNKLSTKPDTRRIFLDKNSMEPVQSAVFFRQSILADSIY